MSVRSSRSGAGASARARYTELAAEGRRQRLAVVAGVGLAAALVATVAIGWRIGLAAGLWAAAAVMVRQWRTDAHRTWKRGAAGERRTARMLAPLTRRGYMLLHDRALPRTRANVDHLVIGPAGVTVVDSKQWNKTRHVRGRSGRLRVGRTSGRTVVKGIIFEARRVGEVLERDLGHPVPVTAVLAVHGLKLPYWRTLEVEGIPLLQASKTRRWITRQPAPLDDVQVAELATAAERLFPAYVEPGRS